jgi:hypothetical protein
MVSHCAPKTVKTAHRALRSEVGLWEKTIRSRDGAQAINNKSISGGMKNALFMH